MVEKTKEQLLADLTEVQKMLEEQTETHGQMIRNFQALIAGEELFSQIIDFFPYPIAIFTPEFKVALVNKAFEAETKLQLSNSEKESVCILRHKIDDTQLASAVSAVFSGDTFILDNVKNPFSMFNAIAQQRAVQPGHFNKALIFPVPADNAVITHGVIAFMP